MRTTPLRLDLVERVALDGRSCAQSYSQGLRSGFAAREIALILPQTVPTAR